jgi:hypothetical protein
MIDDLEPGAVLPAGILEVVDGREIHEDVEGEARLVPAEAEHVREGPAVHDRSGVAEVLVGLHDGGTEAAGEAREDRSTRH